MAQSIMKLRSIVWCATVMLACISGLKVADSTCLAKCTITGAHKYFGEETADCVDRGMNVVPRPICNTTNKLDLTGNNLQILHKDAFESGISLEKMYIRSCRISQIDKYAFRGLVNVFEIDLSDNLLNHIPSQAFGGVPFLYNISLARNPLIEVESFAFKAVRYLQRLDLSYCKIQSIQPNAFDNLLHLSYLKLHDNELQQLPSNMSHSLPNLKFIELHNNKWVCDCYVLSIKIFLLHPTIELPPEKIYCAGGPERLRNISLSDLENENFGCKPSNMTNVHNVQVAVGEKAQFECQAQSDPPATIKWYTGTKRITSDDSRFIDYSGSRVYILNNPGDFHRISTLILDRIKQRDAKEYYCMAENKFGHNETYFNLAVTSAANPLGVLRGQSGDGSLNSQNGPRPNNSRNQQQNDTGCIFPPQFTDQTLNVHCPYTADCSYKAGDHVPSFTQIIVHCSTGYHFSGENTSVSSCFQGKWRPSIPKCNRTCAPIENPDLDLSCFRNLKGLSVPCDEVMPEGAVVYPKCKKYHHQDREVDYSYIQCQSNGQWDRQLFKCIADCGKSQGFAQSLIRYGKPEKRGGSPWHVAIYDLVTIKPPEIICGGTIITPQIIVSAAHCFYDFKYRKFYSPSMFEVVVSKYTRDYNVTDNSDTKLYKIRKIIIPSDIMTFTGDATNYVGDIALLWTSEKIQFNSGVLPACVEWTCTTRFIVPDGTEGKLAGFGLDEHDKPSTVLLTASLPYINHGNCLQMVSEGFIIGADKFCAGSKNGTAARQGDSGGGLLFLNPNIRANLYYLRGVVSNKEAITGSQGTDVAAFTDIAQYTSWMYEKRIQIEKEELLAETNFGSNT